MRACERYQIKWFVDNCSNICWFFYTLDIYGLLYFAFASILCSTHLLHAITQCLHKIKSKNTARPRYKENDRREKKTLPWAPLGPFNKQTLLHTH